MADRNKEIRPAKGVKTQQNKPTQSAAKPVRVIQNVAPEVPLDELAPPTEEAARVLNDLNKVKESLLNSMKEFSSILRDSKLPENKTMEEKRHEQNVVLNLMGAASAIERLSPNEGVLGVAVFALRQSLSLRDAGLKIGYDIHILSNKLNNLENKIKEILLKDE